MALSKATLIDLNSNELILDLDADTSITADTDDTIHIKIAGSDELTLTTTAIAPSTSDGQALGTSSLMFSDLFLASGSVLNFNNGDVTLTHASNLLTLDGGSLDLDGEALILDADGDTKIAESSDDVIHLTFAGSTSTPTEFGAGYINLKNQGTQSYMRFYCESSNAHYTQLQAAAHSAYSGNATVTLPVATSTLATTALSETLTNKTLTSPNIGTSIELLARAEARFQDASGGQFVGLEAPATVSSSFVLTLPAADGSSGQFLKTDGSGALSFDTVSSAADDLTAGDAAVSLTTTAGDITIDAQGNDTDIIFKGTDGSSDTTFLTLDGSDAGTAIFNHDIKIADDGQIGSASDADSMTIASGGAVTFSQNPVFPAGGVDIASLDIDGGTDIGEAIVDADLFIIDNGAGGTNRKTTAARIKTYIGSFDPDGAQTFNDSGAAVDFRVEGDSDTHLLMIDGSSDKIGIGEDVPEGKLHIFTGDASVGPNGDADELVVEGSGAAGISILSGASSTGTINFGDSGDDNVGSIFYDHSDNYLAFQTNGAEGMRVQSNGKLYINHTETISTGVNAHLQVAKNNTAANMVVHAGLNTDGGGSYTISKSRHATPGSSTILQNGDVIGTFRWCAADGVDLTCIAASTDARVDGTPGADDMPTRMGFAVCPDGQNSQFERFRISNNGDLTATDYGGSIGNLSDERMKENIADFTYNLSTFKSLRPRTFTWKNPEQHSGTGTKRGFIAQEIGAVDSLFSYDYDLNKEDLDYSLIYNEDGTLKDDTAGKAKAARLHSKDAMYVSVIKQLITKIETLETKVQALEDA